MNRDGGQPAGYTVVETLIFLAVTGALFVSAMVLVSGQQAKTEFRNAVRDFESAITDVANNVSTGYYTNTGTFQCQPVLNARVKLTGGSDQQGQNQGCIYLGRIIQFGPDGDREKYKIYTAVGNQFKGGGSSGEDVTMFNDALPVLIAPESVSSSVPDASEIHNFGGGVTVEKVRYTESTETMEIGGLGFMNSLQSYSISGQLNSGSIRARLIVPRPSGSSALIRPWNDGATAMDTTIGQSSTAFVAQIDKMKSYNVFDGPSGGVQICLKSNGRDEHAWVMLGGKNGNLTSSVVYEKGGC